MFSLLICDVLKGNCDEGPRQPEEQGSRLCAFYRPGLGIQLRAQSQQAGGE